MSALRPATAWLAAFPRLLRANGFAVAPDQTIGFLEAIGALGPRALDDIRRAGIAMLAVPKDREADYDALFDTHFLGRHMLAEEIADAAETAEAHEATGGEVDLEAPNDQDPAGLEAARTERHATRRLAAPGDGLAGLRRAPLPTRRSYRRTPARSGDAPDLRRTLREAVRRDGEALRLYERRRRSRPRRIVVLIDVSGSMRAQSDMAVRFAHALARRGGPVESFTLGTRLTRITPALKVRDPAEALSRVSALVADIDGGTRLGEALDAFLAVPRFAATARGALVLAISDGLERGDPALLGDAVRRLSRSAWALHWLSPLAVDPAFRPEQTGLAAILPFVDRLGDGSGTDALVRHVLSIGRRA